MKDFVNAQRVVGRGCNCASPKVRGRLGWVRTRVPYDGGGGVTVRVC